MVSLLPGKRIHRCKILEVENAAVFKASSSVLLLLGRMAVGLQEVKLGYREVGEAVDLTQLGRPLLLRPERWRVQV
jgi:hypothetical protein